MAMKKDNYYKELLEEESGLIMNEEIANHEVERTFLIMIGI